MNDKAVLEKTNPGLSSPNRSDFKGLDNLISSEYCCFVRFNLSTRVVPEAESEHSLVSLIASN